VRRRRHYYRLILAVALLSMPGSVSLKHRRRAPQAPGRLFAQINTTVIATFFVCALSVSGAVFLILQLDRSFEGFIQVSSAPRRAALAQLGQ
jgi:hypothetical protein